MIRRLSSASLSLAISAGVYWLMWYILSASHLAATLWPVYLFGLMDIFNYAVATVNNPFFFVLNSVALLAYVVVPIIGCMMLISEVPRLAYSIAADIFEVAK